MIAFDVFLNRKKLARAGVGSDGVLTAMTTWVHRRASRTGRTQRQPQWDRDLSFSLAGYRSTNGDVGEHFKWQDRKLKPGDVLTIKVITAARVDEPRRRVAEDPELVERSQRRYYQRLKRKFEKPRKK
ncbi:MAG: hypothetical protein Q8S00_09520 [Deltaproteobacteria bacterium]|nr:hypothetical protein [Deltaproteobacteria bacterium]